MVLPKLPRELADAVLHGLLYVCRADGQINPEELRELRRCADELGVGDFDEEMILLDDEVPPEALARLVKRETGGPRKKDLPEGPGALHDAILEAAARICIADGSLDPDEMQCLRAMARALGARLVIAGREVATTEEN